MNVPALATILPLVLGLGCNACSSTIGPPTAVKTAETIETMRAETVALVADGGRIYCSGVWIGPSTILTAAHCADPELARDDGRFGFATYADVQPDDLTVRFAKLVRRNEVQDLALLEIDFVIAEHPFARLGSEPVSGQHINIVGHTSGFPYSYTPGWVSGTRSIRGPEQIRGSFTQVWSGAWNGNSGGGAYDDAGRLVGICSWRGPSTTFFVSVAAVKTFVG